MSLELSKEMVSVQGYLADARLILDEKIGKGLSVDSWGKSLIEIARMLQIERHYAQHSRKVASDDKSASAPKQKTDQVMATARKHPQVPMMVSAPNIEPVRERKSRPRKASPMLRNPEPKRRPTKRVEKRTSKPRRR
jgi:hypothetical protein